MVGSGFIAFIQKVLTNFLQVSWLYNFIAGL